MKNKKKKQLSVLLALCLLIAFLPAGPGTVWAEDDTTPPEWVSGYPQAANISDKEFNLRVRTNEVGKAYYVRLDHGETAPSAVQVKAGQDASGNAYGFPQAWSIELETAGIEYSTRIKGLTPGTAYDVYTVLEDSAENLQAEPECVEITTTVPDAANSGITEHTPGVPGYKKVTVYMTVKNEEGIGSRGYSASDFSITVDDEPTTFEDPRFTGFWGSDSLVEPNNGLYYVVFTGTDHNTEYTLTNLTVAGVVIEAGPYTIKTPPPAATAVCQISTVPATPYTSLGEALNNVEDGQTITLLQNINHNTDDPADVITIDSKTVTFNLAGYTLNVGSSSAANAIVVKNGGKLELFGDSGELNVTASGIAVQVEREGSSAVVTSATSRDNCAVYASFGGEITVQGDAEGKTSGAYAVGAPYMISKITVGRDAKSTGDYSAAAQVKSGGQVTVNGNAIATGDHSKGVSAEQNGSKMHVKGNAQGEEHGVYASLSAEVIVDKDVIGAAYGVEARTKSKVTVKGDVSASGGICVLAMSNAQNTPTEVTVDGAITGRDAEYIKLDGVSKSEDDKTIPSTLPGYHTYTQTNSEYNYTSTVWVLADPDIASVEQALNALTFDVIKGSNTAENNILSNLDLITTGASGTTVSWSSNNTAIIADDGTVTRPAEGAGDEEVTLTATVSKGTVIQTKNFYLTVKALISADAEDVAAAKIALTFDVIKGSNTAENNILSNLNLITSGANGTTVSWSSNNTAINADDGTVTRPAQGASNETVTLTATISKGSASDTKPFNLTVKAKTVLDVSGIAVKTQPADLTYTAGETLNLNGLVVTLTYNDSTTLDVGYQNFTAMGISANPAHGTGLTVATHHNKPVTLTCNGETVGTGNLSVTSSSSGDSGGGGGGGASTPPANTTTITPNQIDTQLQTNQSFEVQHEGLQIAIDPEDLPTPPPSGSIQVESTIITDPNALNTFFIQYPGQQGILRGYNITFTQENSSGQSEEITQLNGEITLTFQLTPEELEGIDPCTLVVYKQAEDGSISEYSAEFDWATNSLSISTSHLCEFFIMGKAGVPIQRLAGAERYATAIAISTQGWQTSDYVILASGENFPDALAGTVLAAVNSAPVLLTGKDTLSSETLAEINRLNAKHIYLLGGSGVISKEIENLLAEKYTVTRISGKDRYETAVNIGEIVISTATDTAIIATDSDYPDTLSIASFAGQNGLPILFTGKDGLNTLTAQALSKWGIKKVILVGGSGVISAQTENILREEMKLSVTRLSGTDRYQTGLEIAKYFAESQSAFTYAALATGNNFPDALAGASLAAKLKMPILLTGKDKLSPEIKAYLEGLILDKAYIFGGQGAVPDSVKEEVRKN